MRAAAPCLICLTMLLAALGGTARTQELAIAPRFDNARPFHAGVAPVEAGGKWGLIDRKGELVLEPIHDQIGLGGDGLFPYQKNGKWGFLDAGGKPRIEAIYDDVRPFEDGEAAVSLKGKWGLVRPDGSTKVDFRFSELGGVGKGFVTGKDEKGWAVFRIDDAGDVTRHGALARIYDPQKGEMVRAPPRQLFSISDGAVVAAYPDGERLLDLSDLDGFENEETGAFHSIRRRSEGFAAVKLYDEGGWGYMLINGSSAFYEDFFEDAMIFSEGLAPVKREGKWGFIDRTGKMVIEPIYDAAFPARGGYAVIRTGKKRGFLKNDMGRGLVTFIEPQYEDANRFSEGLAAVKIDGKWGYIRDSSGMMIVDEIEEINAE